MAPTKLASKKDKEEGNAMRVEDKKSFTVPHSPPSEKDPPRLLPPLPSFVSGLSLRVQPLPKFAACAIGKKSGYHLGSFRGTHWHGDRWSARISFGA